MHNTPDIDFVSKDIDTILAEIVTGYENAYFEKTGERKKLYPGDPIRIFLYSQALREFQLRQLIDFSAKQNLLKYAQGNYLENIAGDRRVMRTPACKAAVSIKFTFSAPLTSVQTIIAGTRVTPGNNIYFETLETVDVGIGEVEVIINTTCTEGGVNGNDFLPGQINTLVDPIPFVQSVENTITSQGGAEEETDDQLRERAWLAPESYSVAGPEGAYKFHCKKYATSIIDVLVISPTPGAIDIRVILEGGGLPDSAFLTGLLNFISAEDKRPLTDNVSVNAPGVVNYNINVTYYIASDQSANANLIKQRVKAAVDDFRLWQKSKIGRAINPSKLTSDMINAGASRVDVTSPIFTSITETQIAICQTSTVTYGGVEHA